MEKLTKKHKKHLYKALLKPRLIEEKMLILLRQGKITKWFSGIGQEAIPVGCAEALRSGDTIFTMHRNLGVFTSRKVPLVKLFAQWQGKKAGFTKGRDRSFHFGAPEHNIVGMISHLGPQLSLAGGVALAHKLKGEKHVVLAFTGEGGTSQGEFHEALNVAAVWKLPVIFVIENNGYGLSTPASEQYACAQLADRALGYGMKSKILNGNNIEEVYLNIRAIADEIREEAEPWLVEFRTFRMRGHEEASGTKYVPDELIQEWAKKDPVDNYENYLIEKKILSKSKINRLKENFRNDINEHIQEAFSLPEIESNKEKELNDVYATASYILKSPGDDTIQMRFIDAVSSALEEAMTEHQDLVIMGQDIAEYGGVFKITDGFLEKFGKERIRNTPLCESAIIGNALGLSMKGIKAIVEMQFADFVTCGFNQIVNNLAKIHYRWGHAADVVIRMPTGAGVGAGPYHSQSTEAWFHHTSGLKIVYPSNPYDAKGLLLSAIDDPNPVMYYEHKALYRKLQGDVPKGYYHVEIGKAAVVRSGLSASIITYGLGVHWAQELVEKNNWDVEIIDLRTLLPMDYEAIEATVRKTGKVMVLHEDCLTGGIGGDIAAYIAEHLFNYLDAPVVRIGSMDTPVPFAGNLENQFLPLEELEEKLKSLIAY